MTGRLCRRKMRHESMGSAFGSLDYGGTRLFRTPAQLPSRSSPARARHRTCERAEQHTSLRAIRHHQAGSQGLNAREGEQQHPRSNKHHQSLLQQRVGLGLSEGGSCSRTGRNSFGSSSYSRTRMIIGMFLSSFWRKGCLEEVDEAEEDVD